MTMHLFGTVLTSQAVAHNNRGESEGTVSTLQKVIRNGELFSTVSSEAIRYAMRESWLDDEKLELNRRVSHNGSEWTDKEFKSPERHIDDDVLGYMHAKKETVSRRGILEIGRAVSIGVLSDHFLDLNLVRLVDQPGAGNRHVDGLGQPAILAGIVAAAVFLAIARAALSEDIEEVLIDASAILGMALVGDVVEVVLVLGQIQRQ